jgi:hypothetical protein
MYLDKTNRYWCYIFWPCPQSTWDWPLPEKIDTQPYAVCLDENSTVFKIFVPLGNNQSFIVSVIVYKAPDLAPDFLFVQDV